MADEQKGVMGAGYSLLWRRQGVLWWVFVVNAICGALGTVPPAIRLHRTLDNTLAQEKLTRGFDLMIFSDVLRLPHVNIIRTSTTSYLFALVFFVFMLFVTGGILETYRQDRRLTTSEFFAASGAFFWRFVRLMLLSIIPFVLVSMIYQALNKAADKIGDRAIADQVGIFLGWGAILVFLLMALAVRLWVDIAKVRAVRRDERGMWRNLWRSSRITGGSRWRLFWIYVRISLVAWIVMLIVLAIWNKLPPTATPLTFVLLQVIMLVQLMARLWQLSSATVWYQHLDEPLPVAVVESAPVVEVEEPALEQLPPQSPGPELPPADA